MTQQFLGPKTGTYEPPSLNREEPHLWNTVKKMHENMTSAETKISQLLQLMQEIIGAYDRNDKDTLKFLLKELEKFKKEHYVLHKG